MTDKELRLMLGQNIKRYRAYRKLSQADFAEKVDISIPFLSDIENSKKWLSPLTLVKMAEALDVEVYELFKPEAAVPDKPADLLEKYTADIYSLFGQELNSKLQEYLDKLNNTSSSSSLRPA